MEDASGYQASKVFPVGNPAALRREAGMQQAVEAGMHVLGVLIRAHHTDDTVTRLRPDPPSGAGGRT